MGPTGILRPGTEAVPPSALPRACADDQKCVSMWQACEYVKVMPTDGAHLLGCVIPTGTQTTLPCRPSPTEGLLSLASLWAPRGQFACPMVQY